MAHPFSPRPPLSGPATKKRTFFLWLFYVFLINLIFSAGDVQCIIFFEFMGWGSHHIIKDSLKS